jgi:Domain of unknown function (DUF4304)
MPHYLEKFNRIFLGKTCQLVQHLTRAQARKLVFDAIAPLLKKEGFTHRKGNNFWRITDVKTDVIELQFLKIEERRGLWELPESVFSILYGCHYAFIPHENGERFLHQIGGLLTPREIDCHVRLRAIRTIEQKLSSTSLLFSKWQLWLTPYKKPKLNITAWHLDEPEECQALVLNDVCTQLATEIIPTLNKLIDIGNWIKLLESIEPNFELDSSTNSMSRDYLLGFTYKYLGNKTRAKILLIQAKNQLETLTARIRNATHPSVIKEFPHVLDEPKKLQILINAISEIEK